MAKSSLRQALSQYVKENPAGAVQALKQTGASLQKEEYASLQDGNLNYYSSDQQLSERFNPKVLGILGIDLAAYYAYAQDGKYYFYQQGQDGKYYYAEQDQQYLNQAVKKH